MVRGLTPVGSPTQRLKRPMPPCLFELRTLRRLSLARIGSTHLDPLHKVGNYLLR